MTQHSPNATSPSTHQTAGDAEAQARKEQVREGARALIEAFHGNRLDYDTARRMDALIKIGQRKGYRDPYHWAAHVVLFRAAGDALPEPLMSKRQAADYLGKNERTLERWLRDGVGPRYLRVGRTIRYRRADIDDWLAGREYASQAEELASAAA